MTVVVMRFKASERGLIQRTFAERSWLRQRHNCISARLLADGESPDSVLVLWEFPTRADAQAYLTESMFHYGGAHIADMHHRVIGYYEELDSWPKVLPRDVYASAVNGNPAV
jgi:hypothetical protein